MNRLHVQRAAALRKADGGEEQKVCSTRKDTSHKVSFKLVAEGHDYCRTRKERHAKHGRAACPGVEILRGNLRSVRFWRAQYSIRRY